jgi:hypothetical protein
MDNVLFGTEASKNRVQPIISKVMDVLDESKSGSISKIVFKAALSSIAGNE